MHAYLIIANRNFKQLNLLLRLLDDSRNDIYLLIDQKATYDQAAVKAGIKYSNLYFVAPLKIYWGSYSQIKAELRLFAQAAQKKYAFYHLLSGLDLPLVSQDTIHEFFDQHLHTEFLTFTDKSIATKNRVADRLDVHLYPNISERTFNAKVLRKLYNLYRKAEHLFEHTSHIGLNRLNMDLGYGSNWVSIDHDLVMYILSQKDWIYKKFRHSVLGDELFIHTLVLNSKFKERVYVLDGVHDRPTDRQGNLRYINWWDGGPYTWQQKDLKTLQQVVEQGYFFSRKFDEQADSVIIEQIAANLLAEKAN